MKFDKHVYWKHENCVDTFIKIEGVACNDEGDKNPILYGYWMIQGIDNHWYGSDFQQIKINSENYDKWKPYNLLTSEKV